VKKKPEDVIVALEELDLLDYRSAVNWPEPPSGEERRRFSLRSFGQSSAPKADPELWGSVVAEVESVAHFGSDEALHEVLDVLAWYAPIHTAREDWGIYIRESAVLHLAGRIVARLPGGTTADHAMVWGAIRSAVFCLYHHEAFHHYVESFAIRLELIEGKSRYLPYHLNVYSRPGNSDEPLEEGLACAEQLRRRRKEKGLKGLPHEVHLATERLLKEWIPTLGQGYRQGVALADDDAFHEGRNRLSSQIQSGSPIPTDDGSRWHLIANEVHKGLCRCRSATYWVLDRHHLGRITGLGR
jgi:hypothetical protein|tara:strand:- start:1061 stop:1957 length:897 start_codon:yes stop_codon:yes gene_type:complete